MRCGHVFFVDEAINTDMSPTPLKWLTGKEWRADTEKRLVQLVDVQMYTQVTCSILNRYFSYSFLINLELM